MCVFGVRKDRFGSDVAFSDFQIFFVTRQAQKSITRPDIIYFGPSQTESDTCVCNSACLVSVITGV